MILLFNAISRVFSYTFSKTDGHKGHVQCRLQK